jgi:DNA invertase Pin-like site-specific DNA recombinase
MLERNYDPTQLYRFVRYGRMSSSKQNKRSPEQQFATIDETLRRCGYNWRWIRDYRDDGISGRYVLKRPGLQQMLQDIESDRVTVDLIVVDTFERLGRAEEIASIRQKLFTNHGVLVVTADNSFANPTGIVGKAMGILEAVRATEDTRIKRHNVLRGKKDAARLGRWPGGPAPFGFRLKPVIIESGTTTTVYSALEVEPREAVALQTAFTRAKDTGEGSPRLARWWNENPDIPGDLKPVSAFTMAYRLSNPIYIGTLAWAVNRTGVVNDTRVIEANSEDEVLRIRGFCPPLVGEELFNSVQALMQARGRQIREQRQKSQDGRELKLIAPQTRGLTLKYLLSGLVRCGCCNASMRPVSSGATSKAGRRYTYYNCPRHQDGSCGNNRHVPESELREAVISRLRARLFPPPVHPGEAPAWLPELMSLVRQELERYQNDQPDRMVALTQELEELSRSLSGWATSLGNPELSQVVRSGIEVCYEKARLRQQELQQIVDSERALEQQVQQAFNPQVVTQQLHRLTDVLAAFNPTLGNLELSRHIERIDCFPDGRVVMKGTFLGLFEGAVQLLSREDCGTPPGPAPQPDQRHTPVVPRRRARLRVPDLTADGPTKIGDIDTAIDPLRFAGLPEDMFWTESFLLPKKASWAEQHAEEVFEARLTTGLAWKDLAQRFRKSAPTLRQAYRIAAARRTGESVSDEVLSS